jgi:hypothetical protein
MGKLRQLAPVDVDAAGAGPSRLLASSSIRTCPPLAATVEPDTSGKVKAAGPVLASRRDAVGRAGGGSGSAGKASRGRGRPIGFAAIIRDLGECGERRDCGVR